MQATATIKYVRISSRKLREISRLVSGKPVRSVLDTLRFTNLKASRILSKALTSALANATGAHMDASKTMIRSIQILKGPHFKRWNPVSRGMAHEIKKRTSHLFITLEQKEEVKKQLNDGSKKTISHEPIKPKEVSKVKEKKETNLKGGRK